MNSRHILSALIILCALAMLNGVDAPAKGAAAGPASDATSLPASLPAVGGVRQEGCTIIGAGRLATADRSVITSQSDAAGPGTLIVQPFEGAAFYPYSFKPEKKVTVQDVIAFQRSTFENTIYDKTWDPAWVVPAGGGRLEKSPMATPVISAEMEKVLRIRHHRTIATQGYGMVAQLRSWLPDAVGGICWFCVDNPFVSPYVPVCAGVTDVSPLYKTYDCRGFSEGSARWAVDFVEKLMLLRWQPAATDSTA